MLTTNFSLIAISFTLCPKQHLDLGPQNRMWAYQAKMFQIHYVGEIGDQVDIVFIICEDHLVIGWNGGVPKQSCRERFEDDLLVYGSQDARSPKTVYGCQAGNCRDRGMGEGHVKH